MGKDPLGTAVDTVARFVRAAGLPGVVILLVAAVFWLAIRPVNADSPDRYTGTQAAADWAQQREFNKHITEAINSLAAAQKAHEGVDAHPGTRATLAAIMQGLTDIVRRLDRIEKSLDAGGQK